MGHCPRHFSGSRCLLGMEGTAHGPRFDGGEFGNSAPRPLLLKALWLRVTESEARARAARPRRKNRARGAC